MQPAIILDQSAISVEKTATFSLSREQLPATLFQRGLAGSELISVQIYESPNAFLDDLVIEDGEDAWNESADADVTSTLDAAVSKVGAGSAKLAVAAGASAGDLLATEAVTAKDLSKYDQIKLWIRSTVLTAAGDLQLLLDNTASCASPVLTLDIPALAANTWKHCVIPYDRNTAGLDAIISVGLKYVTDIGAVNINIDDIRAEQAWSDLKAGGSSQDLDVGDPYLRIDQPGQYRVKCTASAGRVSVGIY